MNRRSAVAALLLAAGCAAGVAAGAGTSGVSGGAASSGPATPSGAGAGPGTTPAASAPPPAPQEAGRFAGEFGLWVMLPPDSVVVRWLTPAPVPGTLRALDGERVLAERETPAGFGHRAAFPQPDGGGRIRLRYGAEAEAGGGLHETLIDLAPPERRPPLVTGVDSLFILGDTHGELDLLREGLEAAGLIDREGHWSGGGSHLAFAGDLLDRGPDAIALAWFVHRLEREARAAGGDVHVVLGNHEMMVMLGDLRYVHPKELNIAEVYGVGFDRIFDVRESVLGRWLASRPALMRIDEALVVHGGVADPYASWTLQEVDDTLRSFVSEELFHRWADLTYEPPLDSAAMARRFDFFHAPESLFWHREYVQSDSLPPGLAPALARMEAEVLVVGHTRVEEIEARHGGRLIPAHTPRFGAELLLLVRGPDGYERYRIKPGARERF